MRKRNLLFPLFLGSLFIASNVDSAVFDLYEKRNNILIAGSDCGGPSGGTSVQKKIENNLKRAEKKFTVF